jgi:hypothetical protein
MQDQLQCPRAPRGGGGGTGSASGTFTNLTAHSLQALLYLQRVDREVMISLLIRPLLTKQIQASTKDLSCAIMCSYV